MARSFRGRAPFGAVQRRKTLWSGQDTVGTLVMGNVVRASAGVSIYPVGLEALSVFTITRIIAELSVQFVASDAIGNIAIVYTGIIIVSAEAFAAGAASLPDPRTRQSDDWMYLGMQTLVASATGVNTASGLSAKTMQLDLKGQRKTVPGETVVGVLAIDGLTGSTRTIRGALTYRNLLKLP